MNKIIIASGPVIVEDGKALLNKHGDTKFWKFCGGRVEDFSTNLIANAEREVMEEMGVDIKIANNDPFIFFTRKQIDDGNEIDVILVHFLAERIGEVKPGEDIRDWAWIPVGNLPEDIGPNIKPALEYFKFI